MFLFISIDQGGSHFPLNPGTPSRSDGDLQGTTLGLPSIDKERSGETLVPSFVKFQEASLQVSKRANRVRSVHRYARLHCRGPDGACHARQRDRCYHFSEVASRVLANERLKVSQGLQLMGPTNRTEPAPPSRNDDAQLLLRSALYSIHCLLFIFLIYIMYTLFFSRYFRQRWKNAFLRPGAS